MAETEMSGVECLSLGKNKQKETSCKETELVILDTFVSGKYLLVLSHWEEVLLIAMIIMGHCRVWERKPVSAIFSLVARN